MKLLVVLFRRMSLSSKLSAYLANYNDPHSLGSQFRAKRITALLDMMVQIHATYGCVNLIDIGGTEQYWNIVPQRFFVDHKVNITIVNLPGTNLAKDHGPFKFVACDACNLSVFADKTFHLAHSNSVLEHVGDWSHMCAFASELSRVAEKYFVQTPNYWFPIEPHYMTPLMHWLPHATQCWLVSHFQLGQRKQATSPSEASQLINSTRLLNKKQFQELFRDSEIITERFFGFAKSFIAIKR